MIYALLLVACIVVTRFVVFTALPWMAKTASLYMLHSLREELYSAAREYPPVTRTLFYQDLEFVLCVSIHVSRDLRDRDAQDLAFAGFSRRSKMSSWREPVYEREMSTIYAEREGLLARTKMHSLVDGASNAVLLRAIGARPVALAMLVPLAWVFFLWRLVRRPESKYRNPAETVETFSSFVAKQDLTSAAA